VTVALLRGIISPEDDDQIAAGAFSNASGKDTHGVYWTIFRSWSDQEPLPEVVERFRHFWEWRLNSLEAHDDSARATEEAAGFGWFLRTPHIPDPVLVALGSRSAALANGAFVIEPDWVRIAELAAGDPDGTLGIVEPVLLAHLAGEAWKIRADEVKPTFERILNYGRAESRQRVVRLANRLGEAGFTEFRSLGR
jgi:hypothetical protein